MHDLTTEALLDAVRGWVEIESPTNDAAGVNQRTGGRQTPELSISLLGDFYFNRSETDQQAWAKLREGRATGKIVLVTERNAS